MNKSLIDLYKKLKVRGLTPEEEEKVLAEVRFEGSHGVPEDRIVRDPGSGEKIQGNVDGFYDYHDLSVLQDMRLASGDYHAGLRSLDELLEKDKQREADGFPRKIRVGRMVKPGRGGKDRVVVVPTTVEEKFIHDKLAVRDDEQEASGGSGDGQEGEVIGEEPVRTPEPGSGAGPGEGEEGPHEMESSAYDLGRILTEKFELPNLKDKGKKRSLTRYTYDLTDKHKGFGQVLDKKATLREIVETNINLGNLTDPFAIDPTRFLITPADRVYRILSKEKDYESQAMIFFLRDYSGSMQGKVTELVVTQHVLIYSWLLYQYARQVESRFILHDTSAKEVDDFYTYYNSRVAGGTKVVSAYRLVNEIVEAESLSRDYNIYVFHGTDGDDWDKEGVEALPELKKMLTYANRVGITIAEHAGTTHRGTEVEKYIGKSGLLNEKKELLRLDAVRENADEPRLIEGIKRLIS
ncbi:MAG: DUF444 family protein [Deltaproteobacteria bacterium]|nr:DUF444 family protein [Deltaproteobacteria bacterium]